MKTNLLMAGAIFVIAVLNAFFGERLTHEQGLGWDGTRYGRNALNFPTVISERSSDAYYAQRLLPSGIVHYGLRMMGLPLHVRNAIRGFQALNVLMLTATALLWGLIADRLAVAARGKWLGFVGLFGSFFVLKQTAYYPVLTDVTALAISTLMLLAYLKDRPLILAFVSFLGAFTFPTLVYCGVILLLFPPGPSRPRAALHRAHSHTILAALTAAGITFAAAYVHYGLRFQCRYSVAPPVAETVNLSLVVLAVYLFFATRPLYAQCLRFDEKLLGLRRLGGAALAVALFVGVRVAVAALSQRPSDITLGLFLKTATEVSIAKPLVFGISHVVYFGPVVLLAFFLWPRCCAAARRLGWGFAFLLLLGALLGINSESRTLTTFLPFLVTVAVKACGDVRLDRRFPVSFVVLAFLLSRVWMQFGFTDWTAEEIYEFPPQLYNGCHGPWMGGLMYVVQGSIVVVIGLLLYSSFSARVRTKSGL